VVPFRVDRVLLVGATGHPVFTVGGTVYGWTDIAEFARLRGDWEEIAQEADRGIAAVRQVAPAQDAVGAAARAFRHERRLLSGDDLAAWLERRQVSVAAWLAYVARSLARRERDVEAAAAATDEEVWAEAMCSGRLDDCAETLARLLAVAPGVPLTGLDSAFEDFRLSVTTEEALEREITAARLDWIRIRYVAALFSTEATAGEAALCVREDGLAFADVAITAGVAAAEYEVWLEDADPALAPFLVAARPSELVGPVTTGGGFLLAEVLEKTQVSAADPAVRARAEAAVIERAADRATTDHVVWHDQL
jgi:hypothetical protein